MNENYLWDKTGEPDEEIQQLESLLSEFRYQPRPLLLPVEEPKKVGFSILTYRFAAIAAVLLLALGLGLWNGLRYYPDQLAVSKPAPVVPATPEATPAISPPTKVMASRPSPAVPHPASGHRVSRAAYRSPRQKRLQAEGELAREKVLYALQITSSKLDLISKKIQAEITTN